MANTRKPVAQEIIDAFMELMTEKPFLDITVTDVIKRAGVARASFYRNFSSTRDVLDTAMDNIVARFREYVLTVITSQDEREWRAFLFRYIYYANDNYNKLVLGNTSNISILLYRMSDAAHELSESFSFNNIKEKYRVSSRIAILNSTILRWINDGKKETPEELVDYMMSFILTI